MTESRIERLRSKLKELELDAFLVSTPENRRYLSGFTGSAGYLFISQDQAILATDFRYIEQSREEAPAFEVLRIGNDWEWFPKLIAETGWKRIGFEGLNLTVATYQSLVEQLRGWPQGERPSLLATNGIVEHLRAVKEPQELAWLSRAAEIASQALAAVLPTLRPGMTEREVAWNLEKAMRELGADKPSFDPIVASGPYAALPHHRPSERRLQPGEPIVIDMGAQFKGYCSDITRTVILGQGEEKFRQVYDTVLGAQLTAISLVQEGMSGEEADALARKVIQEAGYGEYFGHGLGHGTGLAVHEYPRLAPKATIKLQRGMVFTIEPGVYLPGWGGVRIEDMALLEEGGVRLLTQVPKIGDARQIDMDSP